LDGNDAELNRLRAENHELRQRLLVEGIINREMVLRSCLLDHLCDA